MSPQEYESYVASVYNKEGYKAFVTPYAGDGGIDIIAQKNGKRIAIQCKNYGHTRSVNADMIRTLYGAAKEQECDEAHMVTDGELLSDAEKAAVKLDVRIRYISPTETIPEFSIPEDIKMAESTTESFVNIDPVQMEKLAKLGSFDELWKKIKDLEKEKVYLLSKKESFNIIKSIDSSGMKRISTNGRDSKVPIEVFRYAFNQLLQNGFVTRDEVNQKYPTRCSSIVVAVLARVLPVDVATNPTTLRVKA